MLLFSAQGHGLKEQYTASLETSNINLSYSTLSVSGMLSQEQDSCVTQAYEGLKGKQNTENYQSGGT